MCEAEDRLEEVENELEKLQDRIASAGPSDFAQGAAIFKRQSWSTTDPEAKRKLEFLAECFELLGCDPDHHLRFDTLAEKISCEMVR